MHDQQFLSKFRSKVFVIAEAGVNHNADVNIAKKLIDVAAESGADAIKFQTFKAEECASRYAHVADYQKNNEHLDQYELLKSLELPFNIFSELKIYAESKKLCFLSTPDGKESLDFLCSLNIAAIKIASGEVNNLPFLMQIAQRQLPVILSTGMSTHGEIQTAINCLSQNGCTDVMLLHCTTSYPTNNEEVNLFAIKSLQKIFSVSTGYSDHTIGNEAALGAVALGAVIIEKHITLDKCMKGPDHKASMNPEEFKEYIASIRKMSILLGSGIKRPSSSEIKIMPDVRRGLVASCHIESGTLLMPNMVKIKRPATGIAPNLIHLSYGRVLTKNIEADEPITWEHLGGKPSFEV